MNEAEKITAIREWWARYWPERKELLEPWMESYFDKYSICCIREFAQAVAEKIRAQSKGHSPEVKRGMLDAARILEQESGERNND